MKDFIRTLFSFLVLFSGLMLIHSCQGQVENPEKDHSEKPHTPLISYKKGPSILSKTTFKTSPENKLGSILKKELFDENQKLIKFISYDFYGSGKKDVETTFEYDERGNKIKSFDGKTTTTWEYDEENNQIKGGWDRKNGTGVKEEYTNNEKGDLIEVKYFTLDGKHDFSRKKEYTYTSSGKIQSEKQWEVYTDGTASLLQYHKSYEYDQKGNILKEHSHRDNGAIYDTEEKEYDANNLIIREYEIETKGDSKEYQTKTIFSYDKYGNLLKDELFNCGSTQSECTNLQYTNTYKFDSFGNMTEMSYAHSDGGAWGERIEIVYDKK